MKTTLRKLRRTIRRLITETSIAPEEWDEFIERAHIGGANHFEWCKNFLIKNCGDLSISDDHIEMMMDLAIESDTRWNDATGSWERVPGTHAELEQLWNEIIDGALSGNPLQY